MRHANVMSYLTIISRVTGLLRDKLCSYFIGVGTEWAAFWMGFQFPNLFRRIFGEGALTAIFVPTYTRVLETQGREAADRLASATVSLLVLVLGGITVLGEAILLPIALSGEVMPANRLAAAMIALMLPYCVMVCVVALLGAIASVHEKFSAQALSPIVLNVLMGLGAGLPVWLFSFAYPRELRVYFVAGAVLVAGVAQVLLMLPTMRRSGVTLRGVMRFRGSGVGKVVTAMLPMIVGLSAVQLNTFLDGQIAWWFSPDGHGGASTFTVLGMTFPTPMEAGALGKLSVAQRIYLLPVGIFGVAMATAIFPLMSKAAVAGDKAELRRLLTAGLRKTLFLSLPASVGMILIARPLIAVVYMGGGTSQADVDRAAWAAVFYCAGIWAFEAQMVILRVFYALQDRMTPLKVAGAMIVFNLGLNLSLIWVLKEGGIAASTTISAAVQCVVLLLLLRKRLGRLGLAQLRGPVWKGLLAAGVMGLAAWDAGAVLGWLGVRGEGRTAQVVLTALVQLPVMVGVAGVVYTGMALMLGMGEVRDMPVVGKVVRRWVTEKKTEA